MPRKPERKAARALPLQARHVHRREREGARHRPFAGLRRALEHERVGRVEPDGAQQLHERGPPVAGSSQEGVASASASDVAIRLRLAAPSHQQVAVGVERRDRALLDPQMLEILPGHGGELARAPGVERQHEVAREALHQPAGAEVVEALRLPARSPAGAGRPPPCPGRPAARWRRTPASPGRRVSAVPAGQASRPPPTRPPSTWMASGQRKSIAPLRRRVRQQRVAQRHHADVEGAACARQRLLRLEHDGELERSKRPTCTSVPAPCLGRDRLGVSERVADLAQASPAEGRRQVERGCRAGLGADLGLAVHLERGASGFLRWRFRLGRL